MRFSKIKDNDIANGLGITMSLWTQGCPHHCRGCFNSETWDFNIEKEFTKDDLKYILDSIDKNKIKRDLSILGGEPLCSQNVEGVINLCKEFKKYYPDKKIYLWTGYTVENFNEIQKEILKYIDVLVDGKFEEDKKSLAIMLRGSSNQRVIDVNKSLKQNDIILYEIG
ncbi:anaerobic ribonucleoside-triphosphate reductase activating protein [Romboutsia sedimentorum]|uniref:Anaerobic ribonucleoside-triphosphate reductase-activating protein n=1 Tax=Romboutsia sedimentorum TaxID=1368474 RepID=A0ABT7E5B0_9FIRM|nr:anaerobic ribonucleoside-triphosphate reductase activating protein [Romboutsia sedimentorum]MDK2562115.1 anaerobic ribonucleoside-triphosphate reductase activating protein [Romboutsia sedimentorum]